MKPSEIVFDDSISNRDKFGVYLKERRMELGMSVRYVAGLIGVTPAYVSDIERGNRVAPLNYLVKLIDVLKLKDDELDDFYDLAGCSHSNWADINDYLKDNPNARRAIRLARDRGLTEELYDWINKIILEEGNKIPDEDIFIR